MKKKVLVVGPALSRSGYGEHTRFLMRSLRKYEDFFDIFLENTNWGNTNWIFEDNEERRWLDSILHKTIFFESTNKDSHKYDISAQVTIPNEWKKRAPINIGVTAGIETTKVSGEWVVQGLEMDKIIVVSNHSKDTYANAVYDATSKATGKVHKNLTCTTPMEVVHYPVRKSKKVDLGFDLEYDFNFLTVAQWGPRKNLDNTIRWFMEENYDKEVGLVVKANIRKNCKIDRVHSEARLKSLLQEFPNRKCKVYLLHGNMSDNEIHSLYVHPKIKCYLTLTHGEGFGLPLFEAAYSGLPIIAPNWSGHVDFLNMPVKQGKGKKAKTKIKAMFAKVAYDLAPIQKEVVWPGVLSEGTMWAYPKQGSFKMKLKDVLSDYTRYTSQAKKLKAWIRKNFKEEDKLKHFAEQIYGSELNKVELDDIPKISILTSVYDGDEYVEQFLEDMTRQTIFKDKCELIMINANSPGNEEEIIMKYKEKFPDNIRYTKLDEDPGIYGVWNLAAEMSTGEFLTNANLDDRKASDSLEKHAKELVRNSDVDLVYADMIITDKPNEKFETNNSQGRRYNFPQFSFDNLKMVNMPHASPMWRKSLHNKYGYFDSKYRSAGDWEMWLRAASQGSKFKKINELLGLYYFNPKGVSTNPDNFEWKQKEEAEVYEKYSNISTEG